MSASGNDAPETTGSPSGGSAASRLALWALACLAPAMTFAETSIHRYYQTDFWHHLARGRAIVTSGRLVNQDRFTFTVSGTELRDPNWLTQVAYYHLYEWGGLALVRTVNSLTLAAAIGLLVFLCHRACGSLVLATGFGILTCFGLTQLLVVRPQSFSILLFAVLLTLLELSKQRRTWLLAAPVLLALWVNVHGIFPIGFVLIGTFALAALWEALRLRGWRFLSDGRLWDLTLCLAAAILATGINPYGFEIYYYVGTTSTSAAARGISEWVPAPLDLLIGKLWVGTILLTLVAFSLPFRRPTARDYCLVLVFLPPTFKAARMIAWWYLAIMPVLAEQFRPVLARIRWPRSTAQPSPLVGGLCLVMLAATMVLSMPQMAGYLSKVPVESDTEMELEKVATYLREHPQAGPRIFSRFEWGEYLGWALQPAGYLIFMDGRIEIIPENVWSDYIALLNGRADWQSILDRYGVTVLVLDRRDPALRDNLLPLVVNSEQWEEVPIESARPDDDADSGAKLFLKRAPADGGP